MSDKAHIGLIDSHAEGDGGNDNYTLLAEKFALVICSGLRRQTSVVRKGIETLILQPVGDVLCFLSREAIHDASIVRVLVFQKF